jgi:hypothetical protein
VAVARGCGRREAGGLYLEAKLGPGGRPVESFLMDPVKPLPEGFKVHAIGVSFVEHPVTKVVNVVDWVGAEHYPNVADFVEEVRRFGLSRKISRNAPIERLTSDSKILLVHGRAFVANHAEYEPLGWCRTHRHQPKEIMLPPNSHCCSVWWEDVTGGLQVQPDPDFAVDPRMVNRGMPSFSYRALSRPTDVSPAYQPAVFAAFPISQLTVVIDPVGRTHEQTLRAAEKAGMWIKVVQEEE